MAGFDFTFPVPKSASRLWVVADAGTQAVIVQAHQAAMQDVLGFMEREVAATRVGKGGVAQKRPRACRVLVAGIAAAVPLIHIEHLAVTHGQTELAAVLLPVSIDGTVAAASLAREV